MGGNNNIAIIIGHWIGSIIGYTIRFTYKAIKKIVGVLIKIVGDKTRDN